VRLPDKSGPECERGYTGSDRADVIAVTESSIVQVSLSQVRFALTSARMFRSAVPERHFCRLFDYIVHGRVGGRGELTHSEQVEGPRQVDLQQLPPHARTDNI
jgi:hypothetical protein